METQSDPKRKGARELSAGGSRNEQTRNRIPEPPKFYSQNYLKRYHHGELSISPLTHQIFNKKSSLIDPHPRVRSQQKESQNDPTVITISSTILKLAGEGESVVCKPETSSTAAAAAVPGEIKKSENSVNPYNRSQGPRENSKPRQESEQDYRYSLINAMSSIKSSYFKCGANSACEEQANEPIFSISGEDESSSDSPSNEIFKKIKSKVDEATKRHKVFLIRGELPRLKEALEERGWIQKYEPNRTRSLPYGSAPNLEAKSLGDVRQPDGSWNERALAYALLRHTPPDLIWDCRNDFAEWDRSIASSVLLNRLQKPGLYTSKLGMAHVLQQETHWLYETNIADVLFPRSYNPSREYHVFTRDFRCCAAVAVLRCFVGRMRNESTSEPEELQKDQADVNIESSACLDWIEFAVRCCEEQVSELEHKDIDCEAASEISDDEWRLFSEDCDKMLYRSDGMRYLQKDSENAERVRACYIAAQSVLQKLKALDPQFLLNGERNIWIVKPSNLCCGSGIFMTHDLKTILRKVENKPRDYYVVQKYIERPFLVYGTKFDIRQWFLVTSTFPMTIWSFREALLRLSSKPYTFATYHEAIHLCNTAVQEKYDYERRRRRNRCASVGEETVEPVVRDQGWDCQKLNEYLKSVGYDGEPYYQKIYPKMSQAIVLTMLAAQDFMDRRRCSFELYGADFMVMEDLSVWLIEINTNPRMHPPSSRITQRLYGTVLDSLVKVVLDLPVNPNANTGGFELIYKQSVPETQPYLGPCLFAFGKTMTLHESPIKRRVNAIAGAERFTNVYGPRGKQYRAWTAPPMIERLKEPKVVDFISYLNNPSTTRYGGRQQSEEDSR